jgi:hypothetical protein
MLACKIGSPLLEPLLPAPTNEDAGAHAGKPGAPSNAACSPGQGKFEQAAACHPEQVINVGVREQLIGVTGGAAASFGRVAG